MSVTKMGHVAIVHTKGNDDCHVILRGGKEPNYSSKDVEKTCQALEKAGLKPMVMIDASHSNSNKQFKKQVDVSRDVAQQVASGDNRIFGLMLESNLVEGRQDLPKDLRNLVYGQSITDACIGMEDTELICAMLNEAVLERRKRNKK
jgi:3-deoxy-7-phosphoheptulonate synthase